ncbi:MAG: polysaccharide biosynthesis/export family protein [Gemmataceae bacterium]|nr:polysaccharide biosynthesis/export family protein [Gemmataceae bacterium]
MDASQRQALAVGALACSLALVGCATDQQTLVSRNLMTAQLSAERNAGVAENYQVGCPDVLELKVDGRSEFNGHYVVEPDGRICLGRYGRVRVQDQTLGEIGRRVADVVGVSPAKVRLRVVEYRSRQVVVIGQVVGWQRSVPYQGQETVLDLLQRVGGITAGAAPREVYVVRAHLGEGRPELFRVDLDAIVLNKDGSTNVRLLPMDHIYVGETRQARIEKCVPPWLRPTYQKLWDMLPSDQRPREHENILSRWISGRYPSEPPEPHNR